MIKKGHKNLCALFYFYNLLRGRIKRRRYWHRAIVENLLTTKAKIKTEFFDFIELYVQRNSENIAEMAFKIQNRILYNFLLSDGKQKHISNVEKVMSREIYENLVKIIDGITPSLTYLANLFKIPQKKFSFIYLLSFLKTDSKLERTLSEIQLNKSFKEILECLNVNSEELIFFLRITLNKMSFDHLTAFLKILKLDSIDLNIMGNLLLIDLPTYTDRETSLTQIKNLLGNSAVFDKLGLCKEFGWAFVRVIQGDMICFKKLISMVSDDVPQNHKYF